MLLAFLVILAFPISNIQFTFHLLQRYSVIRTFSDGNRRNSRIGIFVLSFQTQLFIKVIQLLLSIMVNWTFAQESRRTIRLIKMNINLGQIFVQFLFLNFPFRSFINLMIQVFNVLFLEGVGLSFYFMFFMRLQLKISCFEIFPIFVNISKRILNILLKLFFFIFLLHFFFPSSLYLVLELFLIYLILFYQVFPIDLLPFVLLVNQLHKRIFLVFSPFSLLFFKIKLLKPVMNHFEVVLLIMLLFCSYIFMYCVSSLYFIVYFLFHLLLFVPFVEMSFFLMIVGLIHLTKQFISIQNFPQMLFLLLFLYFFQICVLHFLHHIRPRIRQTVVHFFYPNQQILIQSYLLNDHKNTRDPNSHFTNNKNCLFVLINYRFIIYSQTSMFQNGRPMSETLHLNWIDVDKPGIPCKDLHCDTSCLYEIFHNKAYLVMKKSAKFYLILHSISFLLFRARKIRDRKKLKEALIKFVQTYLGSLFFMSTLVGGNKLFLCFADKIGDQPVFDGKLFWWGSFVSSLSIFFQDKSRREEITYFVFVRALRSIYFAMLRRKWIYIPKDEKTTFILIFGIMSYLFYEQRNLLKHTNIYEALWGEA